MERPLTVLQVALHHPTQGPAAFAKVPPKLQLDTSPLLLGRGQDAHLRLMVSRLSRQHLSLEPYREQGSSLLSFSLRVLSRQGCVWVNGLMLRFLEQVPLGAVNRVAFAGVQMAICIEWGISLEAFVCCVHLSPSPLIYRLKAEETDDHDEIPPQQQPPPGGSGEQTSGSLGFLQDPSPTQDSALQPSPGGGTEIQPRREPPEEALC
ncbi:TRAF-interacting protein with FHA domain-containing protein B [Echinops telfairi]|uniref:TRAF-interacting protein with FHA domain-containing protein B n=1 Tax=Echinops telfairi TaxID=9371 RepID=A0ABM0ICN9_ECHTE|nr:TRAF-interacting protein with FHA domain-containing protein B [Echinops telfairi]